MTEPVQLRPARAGEASALRGIVQHAYEPYLSRIGRRPGPMDDDYDAQVAAGQVTVALLGDQPVGLIVLVADADHLLVANVAVEPAHHGHGIGRLLLTHAERTAAAQHLPELRLYTNAKMVENIALYARLGYRQVDRRCDGGFDRVFMAKPTPAI